MPATMRRPPARLWFKTRSRGRWEHKACREEGRGRLPSGSHPLASQPLVSEEVALVRRWGRHYTWVHTERVPFATRVIDVMAYHPETGQMASKRARAWRDAPPWNSGVRCLPSASSRRLSAASCWTC